MWSRLWRITHALLTLVAVGCCAWLLYREYRKPDPERHTSQADIALRHFLNVKWIGGDYELPVGEDHCAIAILEFEDGKFKGRHVSGVRSIEPDQSRVVPFFVMWGQAPDEKVRLMNGGGIGWMKMDNDRLFSKLDGPISRSYGSFSLGEVRGYRVIGFAASSQMRPGSEEFAPISTSDIQFTIDRRKNVALLGLKPFATRKEAEQWVYGHTEPPDPGTR